MVRAPDAVEAARATIGQKPFGAYGVALADADGNEVDLVPGDRLSKGPETADWHVLFGAMAYYPVDSPGQAGAIVSAVAGLADDAGCVDVGLRPMASRSTVEGPVEDGEGSATTGSWTWLVDPDHARDWGSLRTLRAAFVQLGIDAVDVPAVRAFWASVLGYEYDLRAFVTDIYDPRRLNPVLFFQPMDASDTDRRQHRNRIHIDLFVPYDQAQARIDAAVAAGGRIVTENASDRPPSSTRKATKCKSSRSTRRRRLADCARQRLPLRGQRRSPSAGRDLSARSAKCRRKPPVCHMGSLAAQPSDTW